ncbi:unnamed protein product [Rhodiola kirilowii]
MIVLSIHGRPPEFQPSITISHSRLSYPSRNLHSPMSHNEEIIRLLTKAAVFGDGAVIGLVSAVVTVRLFVRYFEDYAALKRIKLAPEVRVSDLKTLILPEGDSDHDRLVVVKGAVEARSNLDAGSKAFSPNLLISRETDAVGVVLRRTQTCIYNDQKGLYGKIWILRTLFTRSFSEQQQVTLQRKVPFALVDTDSWQESKSAYILVNLDGSSQQLPLETIYHQIHPLKATPFSFLEALFGHNYPVAMTDEEKMLPIGKQVYALGICSSKDGALEIRSSDDYSYFLSNLNKGQMIANLTYKSSVLLWGGIFLGSVSVGILGYSAYRNWTRWKQWRMLRTRPINNSNDNAYAETDAETGEDEAENPDDMVAGMLSCVICLVRSRQYAFVPCGHQVCCFRCASGVQSEMSPQCPVCRRVTQRFLRIYRS